MAKQKSTISRQLAIVGKPVEPEPDYRRSYMDLEPHIRDLERMVRITMNCAVGVVAGDADEDLTLVALERVEEMSKALVKRWDDNLTAVRGEKEGE